MLIDAAGAEANGVVAIDHGEDVAWFTDTRLELASEPSGVASAYHDAAAFAVYDAQASQRVSARLVEATGARSLAYVPLIADQRVIGVLVVAATSKQRAFSGDVLAELQALAAEVAPVIENLRALSVYEGSGLEITRARVLTSLLLNIFSSLVMSLGPLTATPATPVSAVAAGNFPGTSGATTNDWKKGSCCQVAPIEFMANKT